MSRPARNEEPLIRPVEAKLHATARRPRPGEARGGDLTRTRGEKKRADPGGPALVLRTMRLAYLCTSAMAAMVPGPWQIMHCSIGAPAAIAVERTA